MRHMRDNYVKRPEHEALMQGALRAVEKKPLPHMLCVTNMLLNGVEEPDFVRHDNTLARPLVSWTRDERVDIVLTNPPFGGKEEDGIESNFPTFKTRETADLFLALIIRLLKPTGRAAVVLPDGSLFGEGIKTRLKEHLMEECNLHTIVRLPKSVFKPYASIGTNLLFFEKGSPTQDIWYWEHKVPKTQKPHEYFVSFPVMRRSKRRRLGDADDLPSEILARATEAGRRLDLSRVNWIAATILRNVERDLMRAHQREASRQRHHADIDPDEVSTGLSMREPAVSRKRLEEETTRIIGADARLVLRVAIDRLN